MSQFLCVCGNRITDQTDFISYKARFIADQDYDDFCDEIENTSFENQARTIHKYFQMMYQCNNCQNLIIFNEEGRFDFQPIDSEISKNLMSSKFGDKWKGFIIARFYKGTGEIYWNTNFESRFIQNLALEKLKELYYSKFDELKKLEILRSAFLRIDEKIEHEFDHKKL